MALCAVEHQDQHGEEVCAPLVARLPIHDTLSLTAKELARVRRVARWVADKVRRRLVVLCSCHLGLNRSGLVAALAMRQLGVSAAEAIRIIKGTRGPMALSNPYFLIIVKEDARCLS